MYDFSYRIKYYLNQLLLGSTVIEPIPRHTSYPTPATYGSCTGTHNHARVPQDYLRAQNRWSRFVCMLNIQPLTTVHVRIQKAFTNEELNCWGHLRHVFCPGPVWHGEPYGPVARVKYVGTLAILRSHAFVFLRLFGQGLAWNRKFTLTVLPGAHTSTVQDCMGAVQALKYQYDQSSEAIRGM